MYWRRPSDPAIAQEIYPHVYGRLYGGLFGIVFRHPGDHVPANERFPGRPGGPDRPERRPIPGPVLAGCGGAAPWDGQSGIPLYHPVFYRCLWGGWDGGAGGCGRGGQRDGGGGRRLWGGGPGGGQGTGLDGRFPLSGIPGGGGNGRGVFKRRRGQGGEPAVPDGGLRRAAGGLPGGAAVGGALFPASGAAHSGSL